MRITYPEGLTLEPVARKTLRIPRERALPLAALAAIVILAAGLRFANLDAIGYGNTYYTAAVKSMLQSWHNFFFVAAEPGGSVSVDKPPLGLWLQAISAFFLGVNGFAVVLPQIIAGLLSVVLIYHLVRALVWRRRRAAGSAGFGDYAGCHRYRPQQHHRQHADLHSAAGCLGLYQGDYRSVG
jgi:hypothetical protein